MGNGPWTGAHLNPHLIPEATVTCPKLVVCLCVDLDATMIGESKVLRLKGRDSPACARASCYRALKRAFFLAFCCSFRANFILAQWMFAYALQHRSAEPIQTGWLVTPMANREAPSSPSTKLEHARPLQVSVKQRLKARSLDSHLDIPVHMP